MKIVTSRSARFKILMNYLKFRHQTELSPYLYIDVNEKTVEHEYD